MAVVSVQTSQKEYNIADQELQDRLAYIYGSKENELDLFRPALADQQKIGFFSLDRCSQTDISEVVDLKEMTEVLQILLQDVATLRRDINFIKHVMHADYEKKLQEKSLELYCRINEKAEQLEKAHEERVDTIRRAYRRQLANSVSRYSIICQRKLDNRLLNERNRQAEGAGMMDEKYKELQQTIHRNESMIQMLKMQLAQYQQKSATEMAVIEEESFHSETPGATIEEVEQMQMQMAKMEKQIGRLEEALDIKDEETMQLNSEVDKLTDDVEKQKMMIEQLKHEKNELKSMNEQDKASAKRMMERQKNEMERMMREKIELAAEEAKKEVKKVKPGSLEEDKEKIKLLMNQKKLLEEQLQRENRKSANVSEEIVDAEKMKKAEQKMRDEVQRLKRELERVHRTWEKKFAILQQSLHALKDESYLRQSLQRQAAQLHQAAVSYTVDTPAGIVPTKAGSSSSKKQPLPDIPRSGKSHRGRGGGQVPGGGSGLGEKDCISYTVSAPSGRGTAMFSVDENQVMSDDQDMPEDVVPLPQPPPLNQNSAGDTGEDGHSSSRVVVMPSVEAV